MAEHRKRIFNNFISLSVVQGLSIFFPLIIFPYLLQILGVEGFGVFTLIQTVIMYADLLVSFGFGLTATKHIAKNISDKEKTNNIITSVYFIKIILFLIPLILFLIAAVFIPYLRNHFVLILISCMYVLGNLLFPDWYFQGIQKMRNITIVAFVSKCISLLLIILFVKHRTDVGYAIMAISVGNFIAGLVGFFILIKSISIKLQLAPRRYILSFFKESGYVFSSIILVPLYSSVNIFILRAFTNPLMVGYYAIAEKIFSAVSMLTSIANRTFYPHLSQLYSKSVEAYKKNVQKISLLFLMSFAFLGLMQFISADFIVRFISGKQNVQDVGYAIEVLKIMSIGVLFSPFGSFFFQLLIIQGQKKSAVKNIFSVVVINVFTASTLAYLYGGIGMAINLCLIVTFIAVFNYFSYRKKLS